ncbi:metal-dependent transcriptional regulator [Desulfogranum japonicum]|uniref:metal-dependent transcriptional regulator n=1 Tax=Desulfogranum japonicum TaxID=231447 RepID=UPI0013787071|nr:FeoA domain-containing protein [Desulfogranum japonicum]
MDEQTLIQHALKLFAECDYDQQDISTELMQDKLAITPEQILQLLQNLRTAELVEQDSFALTASGREYALHVLQAHRLYETYLARKTGHSESIWHQLADEREHELSKDDVKKLAEELGHPRFDPHGDPIPTASGEMPAKQGNPLVNFSAGWEGRVVHIEDEPSHLYTRISQAGITTDSVLRIEQANTKEIHIRLEGQTFIFPHAVAEQITVVALGNDDTFDESIERLSTLKPGEKAEIVGMSSLCRGLERSRLLDLGVVPGTVATVQLLNPSGSPIGYAIRGACIALRKEQAEHIRIRKVRQ